MNKRHFSRILLCLLLYAGSSGAAFACTCSPLSAAEAIAQADLVFQGRVTSVETNWISGGWKFAFEVSQSWKKTTNRLYIVNTPWEKDCGYVFEQGREYLVFVKRKFTPKTNRCMGNKPIEEAAEYLALLGRGNTPMRSANYTKMIWLVSLAGFLGLAFVAFVVLRKKIRPR
ncbi:MAG: hypothetical protein D6730_10195 [Bacteroidetes bacterium]|nr:MAG: hypothetical protein D6730_10195 [Bacteroidota bacterium]